MLYEVITEKVIVKVQESASYLVRVFRVHILIFIIVIEPEIFVEHSGEYRNNFV